jgi:ATP-dependent helicase HrpA
MTAELNALVPPRFLDQVEFEALVHLPRYLKALLTRIERAALNPAKDQEKARQLAPYAAALAQLESGRGLSREKMALIQEFRSMLNEFKVSIFAQELGTAIPVSPKRLDQQLERVRLSA